MTLNCVVVDDSAIQRLSIVKLVENHPGLNLISEYSSALETKNGLRRLIPMELERLNMFPDNFTEHGEVPPNKRAFLMGNALVIGVVEKLGESLAKRTKGK